MVRCDRPRLGGLALENQGKIIMLTRSHLQIPHPTQPIDSYWVTPKNPVAVIIVIHEVFGINDWLKSVCDRLAYEGYAAIAPNMVHRTAPELNLDYSDESLALGRWHKDQMTVAGIEADYRSVVSYLRSLGFKEIGNLGFCFGGHIAFLGAMQPAILATDVFYGSGIGLLTPGGEGVTMERSSEIRGRIHLHYGTQDPLISNEQTDQVEAALKQSGVRHQMFRYEAGHGFFCEARSSFDSSAASLAWERVKEGFAIGLGRGEEAPRIGG